MLSNAFQRLNLHRASSKKPEAAEPSPNDGQPSIWVDGTREWLRDGKRHRADGPALERPSGMRAWYRHGILHRDDGPAIEWADGTKEWVRDGELHRDDGPAIERRDGNNVWYFNGVVQAAAVSAHKVAPRSSIYRRYNLMYWHR